MNTRRNFLESLVDDVGQNVRIEDRLFHDVNLAYRSLRLAMTSSIASLNSGLMANIPKIGIDSAISRLGSRRGLRITESDSGIAESTGMPTKPLPARTSFTDVVCDSPASIMRSSACSALMRCSDARVWMTWHAGCLSGSLGENRKSVTLPLTHITASEPNWHRKRFIAQRNGLPES